MASLLLERESDARKRPPLSPTLSALGTGRDLELWPPSREHELRSMKKSQYVEPSRLAGWAELALARG